VWSLKINQLPYMLWWKFSCFPIFSTKHDFFQLPEIFGFSDIGKVGDSYSLEVATTAHVTPFFLAVLGVTTALPFIYLTPRCHGFLKTLTQ
jgi:hypothetical protein